MRTKVLISAAALVAASALTSMAQNVYSLNVVGYVNLSLVEGYNLVANQLDADGTGVNNTIAGVFGSQLPSGSEVYTWNGTGFNTGVTYSPPGKGGGSPVWSSTTATLNPGQGAYVQVPSAVTVTTVGQVLQGSLVNPYITAGAGSYSFLSSMVPLAGSISSMGYGATTGDAIYFYDTTLTPPGFDAAYQFAPTGKGGTGTPVWQPSVPMLSVGQGFILQAGGASTVWSNYFTVQ